MKLDQNALEAAYATARCEAGEGVDENVIKAAITAYLSASVPADVAELLDELHNSRFGTWMAAINWCFRAADTISALSAKVEELTRERNNLQARLTARAKSMLRLREKLAEAHDNIEDEGDRVYFGSTNDADTFREVWRDLDAWAWDDIVSEGNLTDIYEVSRKAHERLAAAEASLAERDRIIAEKDKALDGLLHAVCGPTGFAAAVRTVSGLAYPWPELELAEHDARAARDRRAS